MTHAHWDDASLIELALETRTEARERFVDAGVDARGRGAEVAQCAQCAAKFAWWRASLERTRAAARAIDVGDASALAERVLARTTRAPIVPDIARASEPILAPRQPARRLALRLAAALVLAPALGVALWQARTPRDATTSSDRVATSDAAPVATSDAATLASAPATSDARPAEAPALDSQQTALERARAHLARVALAAQEASARTAVGSMLRARASWLDTRDPRALAAQDGEGIERALAWHGPVRALCCELLLDRYVLEGRAPEELDAALAALLDAPARDEAERRLELAALARARDCGLLDASKQARLQRELARAGIDAHEDPLYSGEPRRGAPIDVVWLDALEAALDRAERSDPVVTAWLEHAP